LDNNLLLSQPQPDLFINQNGFYAVKSVKTLLTTTNRVLECRSGLSTQFGMTIDKNLYGISVYANPVVDGKLKIATDRERLNVKITIFNDAGQKVYDTTLEKLKLPTEIDLSSKGLHGKYILKMDYTGFSRSFPLFFK
jgi:hypothetical protein